MKVQTKLNSRSGSAVVVALSIATLLLFAEAWLMSQTQNQIKQSEQHVARLQAWFAARSVMQHAMLKIQLMPTQLYDAAAFSVGKNPFFDFTEYEVKPEAVFPSLQIGSRYLKRASDLNPGPRFITVFSGSLPADEFERWTQITQFDPEDLQHTPNVNPWPKDSDGNDIPNPELYLKKFYDDIRFEAAADNAMSETPYEFPQGFPYEFSYSVDRLEVVAVQEQRKYNEEAVKISARGMCGYRQNRFEQKYSSIIRIKRN